MANVLFRTHLGADVVVEDIINRLAERGHIDQQRKAKWKRLKRARNEFYHEDYLPTREDTREVLAEVEWLEHKVNRLEDGRSRS
jgi:polyhydroxyalkanoate synthesis regulator phasin